MIPHSPEHAANDILREWAMRQGVSLRKLGIIDERRRKAIDSREVCFTTFFERGKRVRGGE